MGEVQKRLDSHRDEILAEYATGAGCKTLGRKYGCSAWSVYEWIKRNAPAVHPKAGSDNLFEKYKDRLIELHTQGLSAYAISKELGVADTTPLVWLKKLGLSTSHLSKSRTDPLGQYADEIVQLYNSGLSTLKIGDIFEASSVSVWKILQSRGVQIRPHAIYEADHSFFDRIDTGEKAYVLGLFYADGYVNREQTLLKLNLTDVDILERVRVALGYTGPLHAPKTRPGRQTIYPLQIYSPPLARGIVSKGCLHAKTYTLEFPTPEMVPAHLLSHFIRGYFDGDGCIAQNKNTRQWNISFVGTLSMMEGIAFAANVKPTLDQRHPERNVNNWNLRVYRVAEMESLIRWMYDGATIYLERKKVKCDQFLTRPTRSESALRRRQREREARSGVIPS